MVFHFKINQKDIIMTKEDEELYREKNICRFGEKNIESDNVRDHCHLTGCYRGPARQSCNINVTRKHSSLIPFVFHNFSKKDCHLFFKKWVDRKNDKVKIDIIPKTIGKNKSKLYGCIRIIDSYRFSSSSLDSLVKTIVDNSYKALKQLKEQIVDNDEIFKIVNDIKT